MSIQLFPFLFSFSFPLADAHAEGEPVVWDVFVDGHRAETVTGRWRFSSAAAAPCVGDHCEGMFSAEDGSWGAAAGGDVDGGDPDSCLGARGPGEGAWGQENCGGGDGRCGTVIWDGVPRAAEGGLVNEMFFGLSALAAVEPASGLITGTVVDLGTEGHEVRYVPRAAGRYLLSVTLDTPAEAHGDLGPAAVAESVSGRHIAGSPFALLVAQGGPVAETSTARGSGLRHAVAGVAATFEVTTRDEEGNGIGDGGAALAATFDSGAPVAMLDRGDGSYLFNYTLEARGTHELSVALGGSHIQGSPFAVVAEASVVDAGHCELRAPGGCRLVEPSCGPEARPTSTVVADALFAFRADGFELSANAPAEIRPGARVVVAKAAHPSNDRGFEVVDVRGGRVVLDVAAGALVPGVDAGGVELRVGG